MEEINSSMDNIVSKFNESITHTAPMKLSFEEADDSFSLPNRALKRRRISDKSPGATPNTSQLSASMQSTQCSPWVVRTMKSDLLAATAKIAQLEEELQRRTHLQRETELLQENKILALKKQADYSGKKIEQLESHMQILREREQCAKRAKIEADAKLEALERTTKDKLTQLQSERQREASEARSERNDLLNELSQVRIKCEKAEMEANLANDELSKLRKLVAEQKQRISDYDDLRQNYEQLDTSLCVAKNRVTELEQEIANYADWKDITEKAQARLSSIPDMQRELERLTTSNKHLNGLIGNNLLLKEQVDDLSARLQKNENALTDLVTLQVKFSNMEQELKEWIAVAQDHCLPNMVVSPLALRSRIEKLLQQEVVLASQHNQSLSKSKSMKNLSGDLQKKCEVLEKNISSLEEKLAKYRDFKERMQKKLTIVSRERDFYKQLVENFEKDATLCQFDSTMNDTTATTGVEQNLRMRLEMALRTIDSYKTMTESLKCEVNEARQQQNADNETNSAVDVIDASEALKAQIFNLELDNDRLRRRKEELELEVLQGCLKNGNSAASAGKVVHLRDNPADEFFKNYQDTIEKLQAEIERLKRRISQLESGDGPAPLNEDNGLTANFKEINQLTAELEASNAKMKKIKDVYKAASMEYRDVCYMLLGYRIDRIVQGGATIYNVSSMYSKNTEDHISFHLSEDDSLELIGTPYLKLELLQTLIKTQLLTTQSLPVFLSNLTLELFQQSQMAANDTEA